MTKEKQVNTRKTEMKALKGILYLKKNYLSS